MLEQVKNTIRAIFASPNMAERRPVVDDHFESDIRGLYVVGDLSGAPVIKLAMKQGFEVIEHIASRPDARSKSANVYDLIIAGAGAAPGAIAVVHGHGDNGPAVQTWASRFTGTTVATTQSRPSGGLVNFGGFTDGDRAVYLADHFGAKEIRLVGWDFEHPSPKDGDLKRKQRKLDWAYILIQNLDRPDLEL